MYTEIKENNVEIGARTHLKPHTINHLESDINYTCIYYLNGKNRVISYTLGKVHAKLSSNLFIRSCVVNLDFIERKSLPNHLVAGR